MPALVASRSSPVTSAGTSLASLGGNFRLHSCLERTETSLGVTGSFALPHDKLTLSSVHAKNTSEKLRVRGPPAQLWAGVPGAPAPHHPHTAFQTAGFPLLTGCQPVEWVWPASLKKKNRNEVEDYTLQEGLMALRAVSLGSAWMC